MLKKMAYDVMLDDDEGLFFNDVEHMTNLLYLALIPYFDHL